MNQLVALPNPGVAWEKAPGRLITVMAVMPQTDALDGPPEAGEIVVAQAQELRAPSARRWLPWENRALAQGDEELRDYAAQLVRQADGIREGSKRAARVASLMSPYTFSEPVLAAVQLLRQDWTMRHRPTGNLWRAEWSDLSPAGVLLLNQMHVAYVRSPWLLTLVDE